MKGNSARGALVPGLMLLPGARGGRGGTYRPGNASMRGGMAAFIVRTFCLNQLTNRRKG